MKKKILIVSKYFYPQNSPRSFRTTELTKEFAKLGHDVTLIIPKNDKIHPTFEKAYNITIKDLGKRKFTELDVRPDESKALIFFKRALRRVLLLLFEYPDIELMFLVKKALKNEKNYDLLISIAAPHTIHWGVAWAWKKKSNIANTWVADCGDPYYLSIHDSFKKIFYFKYLENWFSKKADYISIPFEGLKKYFFKEYDDKYRIIPQGFNFEDIEISNKPIDNEVVTFAFAGGFIKNSRDPRKFFDLLLKVKIPFQFIVYNRQPEFTQPYKEVLGNKLIIKNYVPREQLLNELSRMDFLVNFEYDITNQLPSKLIDYSLVKRPILLIINKKFNTVVINEFLKKNYTNQFRFDQIERYNIKFVALQFLDLIR